MNNTVALHQAPEGQRGLSVIAAMATGYGMRAEAFEATLRATVVPKACTREEFAAFVLVARQYNLNPITREIYAIPKKGGGIQPVVGVDGWYSMMNEHPQFDGIEFEDHFDANGEFAAITCRIWRKDRSHAIAVTEYLSECRQRTEPWDKWPRRMTRHKAGIQTVRIAFGFSGIVDPDEADRFTRIESAGHGVASAHATASRALQTIDAAANDFGPSEDFAAEPAPPETSAVPPLADAPASSSTAPAGDEAGIPTAMEQARLAGREACRRGEGFESIPPKYARYTKLKPAWEEGFLDEGERMEAEMSQ